jgi:hypothetical protein
MSHVDTRPPFALTPWVRRLIAANAVVYLLTITVFTGAWFPQTFAFAPSAALTQPWTFLTYMFVHGGFLHLAFNMLMLFFFGPAVEDQMGGRPSWVPRERSSACPWPSRSTGRTPRSSSSRFRSPSRRSGWS